MSTFFALDKEFVPCRAEGRASEAGRAAGRAMGGCGVTALQAACTGKGQTRGGGGRARAERTKNISVNSVTLDVSKLSDWLNADANCRESKGGHAVRGEVYGSGGNRRWASAVARSVQGRARLQIGGRAHTEERTLNM